MRIVLLGIQGSGKTTQGTLLSKQLKIPYLSTGHIFRQLAKEKTQLGRYIKETINAGILVPDEKTIEIVNNYIKRKEYKKGYILDGFPRTLRQAKEFANNVDKVIYFDIEPKEALWRIFHRNDELREDETTKAIRKRIDLFFKYTMPVIKFYERKKKLITIDATQTIEKINQEILKNLGKQVIKNQIKNWKKKEKTIIAIVGLPGSGKTEAAQYFKRKGLPVISFGRIVNEYIDKHGLSHTEEIHRKIREDLRKKYGLAAFAILNEEKIKKAFKDNLMVVIDGMRSWEEYIFLKKKFPKIKLIILAIYADREIRYERLTKRKYRKNLGGETRDINELLGTNMGPTIAFADYLIKNNYSLSEFYDKLDEFYRIVYFS
ncbi:MAG: nucleoside monophosphate kinase [Microgenomates group bacterium]